MNQEMNTNSKTYTHCLALYQAAVRDAALKWLDETLALDRSASRPVASITAMYAKSALARWMDDGIAYIDYAAAPDLLAALAAAVARVEVANEEGDPLLSAWLPIARAALALAEETTHADSP